MEKITTRLVRENLQKQPRLAFLRRIKPDQDITDIDEGLEHDLENIEALIHKIASSFLAEREQLALFK
ncbi:MAG: hypothetical protein AB1641_09740 [Thermodesulfobacteriota bacterium]